MSGETDRQSPLYEIPPLPTQPEPAPDDAKPEEAQPRPEHTPSPEQEGNFELQEESPALEEEQAVADTIDGLKQTLKGYKRKPKQIPQVRDPLTIQIEAVMSEGLDDFYRSLTPIQQQQLKIKGEKIALEIRDLFRQTHLKVKKIFILILEWLKLLPGINHFFLEQEAKIKTDKILALKHFDTPK